MYNADLAHMASVHIRLMDEKYHEKIQSSVDRALVFDGSATEGMFKERKPHISVCKCTTTDAALMYPHCTLLNFASYKHPGGQFINGAMAQEEAICHDSTLYNVLYKCGAYYAKNRNWLNKGLYTDRALYTPDIIFEKEGRSSLCNVITCAAPNWSAARRNQVEYEDNVNALRSRINFLIDVAEAVNTRTLILGAWGCGVFKQSCQNVAWLFEERLKNTSINTIIFAIPDVANYSVFAGTFDDFSDIRIPYMVISDLTQPEYSYLSSDYMCEINYGNTTYGSAADVISAEGSATCADMYMVTLAKFMQHEDLLERLKATGNAFIYTAEDENVLGMALMLVRDSFT